MNKHVCYFVFLLLSDIVLFGIDVSVGDWLVSEEVLL